MIHEVKARGLCGCDNYAPILGENGWYCTTCDTPLKTIFELYCDAYSKQFGDTDEYAKIFNG